MVCDLKTSNGEELAKDNSNVLFVPTDVTSEAEVKNALDASTAKFGDLNVIVNCAGVGFGAKLYDRNNGSTHTVDDFVRVLMVSQRFNLNKTNTNFYSRSFFGISPTGEHRWHIQCDAFGCCCDGQK